jgi:hypothetical protein
LLQPLRKTSRGERLPRFTETLLLLPDLTLPLMYTPMPFQPAKRRAPPPLPDIVFDELGASRLANANASAAAAGAGAAAGASAPERFDFYVNCPWVGMKYTSHYLRILQRIQERVGSVLAPLGLSGMRHLVFRFFIGIDVLSELSIGAELQRLFGAAHTQLMFTPDAAQYATAFSEGHLFSDGHYRSVNTIFDALTTRTPMLLLDPPAAPEAHLSATLLAKAQLSDAMVVETDDEVVTRSVRLILNSTAWHEAETRLRAVDLEQTFFQNGDEEHAALAVHYMVANHNRIQKRGAPAFIRLRQLSERLRDIQGSRSSQQTQ